MVRAGEGGYQISEFERASCVAIGWEAAGDFTDVTSIDAMRARIDVAYPDAKPLDYRELLVFEADGETEVKIATAGRVVKLPLGKLLDNFEELDSRRERVTRKTTRG